MVDAVLREPIGEYFPRCAVSLSNVNPQKGKPRKHEKEVPRKHENTKTIEVWSLVLFFRDFSVFSRLWTFRVSCRRRRHRACGHRPCQADAPVAKPALPNPYRLDPDWPTLPASMKGPNGRKWGEVIRVHVAPGGNIWVFHRCFNDQPNGDATCVNEARRIRRFSSSIRQASCPGASASVSSRTRTDSPSIATGISGRPTPTTNRPTRRSGRRSSSRVPPAAS